MRLAFIICLCLLPCSTHAALIISEVAWMGSTISANHEWIELQNTSGAAVDVTGWILSDGANLSIPLSGTIAGNEYVVVERTSDDSAAGTAFLIYTGALVNTGATLTLKRSDGGLEDQVGGDSDWKNIGGDNVTKETAQYTTAGWVTGKGTPGARNSGAIKDNTGTTSTTTTNNSTNSKGSNSKETVRLILPGVSLALDIDGQTVGYVNQAIDFSVGAKGIGKTLVGSLSYEWNFGEGNRAFGEKTTHIFAYPGKYVVRVYGSYMRQEQVARHEITILPVALSLTTSNRGDVQISNDSPYELDISGYKIEGKKSFVFPAYSVLLPNQTITIPQKLVGSPYARIKDTTGAVISTRVSPFVTEQKEVVVSESLTAYLVPQTKLSQLDSVELPQGEVSKNYVLLATSSPTEIEGERFVATAYAAASSSKPIPSNAWPYIGLIGVIIIGLFGTAQKLMRNQTG